MTSNSSQPPVPLGSIVWQDLTVADASAVRDFYARVVGWLSTDHDMVGYSDFNMHDSEGKVVAGVCHARDTNANVPPQWLVYVKVDDADAAADRAISAGGQVVDGPRSMGTSRFVVVRDPAGAVIALIS
ncbi:MAG: hypothetical protein AMXMBFR58_01550 [Phycisphaerae bacterium]|nr:hypothetical protein [Phycisphaerales bacterium]MCK6477066.1 VOC family protein [Phycisphaerales bacterium]